jgi:hypothetical protein
MADRAEVYRKRADECRAQAEITKDPDQKREYLEMADSWLKLAQHAQYWHRRTEGKDS